MSLPALPAELIDAVAQNLDTPALVALARTASPLYPVARRLLYRNLALSPLAHNLVLVPVLAARPHLARFVRTFSLVLPSSSVLFPPFYRALASALAAMTQLTDLDLHIDPDATWVLASAPLYPRLSHFAASFPLDLHTAHFLARTPALEHLQLDSVSLPPPTPPPLPAPAPAPTPATPSLPPLPPSTVSILASFSGPAHIARLLAPTRPLHTLHIHDGDLTPDDCAWLATAAGPLAVLSATATAATAAPPLVPLLHALARALPDLACLRLAPPTTTSASPGTGAPTAPALLKAPDTVRLAARVSRYPRFRSRSPPLHLRRPSTSTSHARSPSCPRSRTLSSMACTGGRPPPPPSTPTNTPPASGSPPRSSLPPAPQNPSPRSRSSRSRRPTRGRTRPKARSGTRPSSRSTRTEPVGGARCPPCVLPLRSAFSHPAPRFPAPHSPFLRPR